MSGPGTWGWTCPLRRSSTGSCTREARRPRGWTSSCPGGRGASGWGLTDRDEPEAPGMVRFAFKEWAVVCQALAGGRQALILRKGGIAEAGGAFRPDHTRFWLFPTYLHQTAEALKPPVAATLPAVERERPLAN